MWFGVFSIATKERSLFVSIDLSRLELPRPGIIRPSLDTDRVKHNATIYRRRQEESWPRHLVYIFTSAGVASIRQLAQSSADIPMIVLV